jgi:hypothetical protein
MSLIKRYLPLGIIILELIVFGNGFWNGLRLSEAIFFGKTLEIYRASPQYITISGGFWFISAVSLGTGIWLRKPWAWAGSMAGAASYSIWYWMDRIFLQAPHSNWLFALVVTLLLLAISTAILFNAKTRRYFHKLER